MEQAKQDFPTFCYNVKNIQMIPSGSTGVNLLEDNKTIQYIAQPFTTSYGGQSYALVNPVHFSGQNGQIVINKPISANSISSISFKCDTLGCNQIFPHLTGLNQHKRTHNQEDGHSDTVTVVTQQQPNIIQAQNLISESGQNLGQIQIVAADSLEPAQIQHAINEQINIVQQQQQQQQQQPTQQKADNKQKCITCGGHIQQNPKRKGPKLIRCETCIQNDANAQNVRPTQIFVSPDGDIKFELNELGQNVIQIQNAVPKQTVSKKRNNNNVTTVTKCTTCNGSGVILVTENNSPPSPVAANNNSKASTTMRTIQSPQKIQQIQIQTVHQTDSLSPAIQQQNQQTTSTNQVHHVQTHAPPQNQSAQQSQQDKPFQCTVCGGRFSRYSSLWSHKKLHTGEKNYKCSQCGAQFAKAVYLKNHMRIHSGEKPYRCGTCGMQFSQSPHLKNHERTHTGEKPYVCQICDKGFARHATLWNHRRIHTGEKPYKCGRCQSAFSQAAHLKNHEKVHLGIKPYKCEICGGSFADRFALKRHRNIHEKYGQTVPLAHTQTTMDSHDTLDESMLKEESDEDEIKGEIMSME